MRMLSLILGGLLLVTGAGVVVMADLQRHEAVDRARIQLEDAEARRDSARAANLELAEELTGLRVAIADLEAELADTDGFLK